MAGLSTNSDKIDEELRSMVVSQLNMIRVGLNKQQEGIINAKGCTGEGNLIAIQFLHIEPVELKYMYLLWFVLGSTGRMPKLKYM